MGSYVVLLRHGTAVAEEADPERPLDSEGTMQASMTGLEVGATLTGYGVKQVRLLHSSKLRAKQTAELVAKELENVKIPTTVSETEGLKPNDDFKGIIARIKKERPEPKSALLLVGHLPQLHKVSTALGFDALEEKDFPAAGGLLIEYPETDDPEEEWDLLRQFDGE
mmetsp:Transcript_45167/g.75351  ORF Transcript_45167/g.75351 Transcript_45167/m.75351 type:complete len:167 (-) Transcript_45167:255-755(-)|eukprot:CAMPEP_0198212936 /NCGR_PEP_ID=MMETSP1445-20131203/28335_1 /TAXON_ID=36898 /ORGANISM="Pyramimonas sp., Strain CCMP2087" /LENGTH=166 /DNA_ID=CAMNT_0043887511 /DNA_START=141 /DNA_END=641 /DNA_ORIENTATION=+